MQDQVYDEKQNTVTIKVVCCDPEKIKQKICYKGGKSIKSIEIVPPPKPSEKPKEPEKPKDAPKRKEPEKPKEKPAAPAPAPGKKTPIGEPAGDTKQGDDRRPPASKATEKPPTKVVTELQALDYPPGYVYPVPFGVCCRECSERQRGGACEQLAYGRPPCHGQYYGRPVCDRWGGSCACGCNRSYYWRNRCGYYYYCEENPPACSIM